MTLFRCKSTPKAVCPLRHTILRIYKSKFYITISGRSDPDQESVIRRSGSPFF
ncbi:hypothetical protein AGABI2DRAFT_192188 [Agaricus bisporus var. bisporus H97]|uniref:hypothetical protein n=1 Tax=Agaricus bisporus var. bisporus (strain H97 / ATCC MYA-4626 / FGSC 10389) TaxID=936046 RepID=UPI00029F5A86|nr:hypothetical protein AGABI2DRAFT_192188 [Agaricus bisporus var. bisporus H97]EKV48628.1 hypothetical protein AGABI2DRAFT_192188 [Agaricus bisporus var. bisporus H97]